MKWWLLLALAFVMPINAQTSGILLVAKPDMTDPNFREAVVVVTRAEDGSTIGVILNRPTQRRMGNFPDPLYEGGPVMREAVLAMFAGDAPGEFAFEVLPHVYLTMHPSNIEALVANPPARMRLFSGFAGWAPRQLEAEMAEGAWYAVRATEADLFRKDTSGLWRELVERAGGSRTGNDSPTFVARR